MRVYVCPNTKHFVRGLVCLAIMVTAAEPFLAALVEAVENCLRMRNQALRVARRLCKLAKEKFRILSARVCT